MVLFHFSNFLESFYDFQTKQELNICCFFMVYGNTVYLTSQSSSLVLVYSTSTVSTRVLVLYLHRRSFTVWDDLWCKAYTLSKSPFTTLQKNNIGKGNGYSILAGMLSYCCLQMSKYYREGTYRLRGWRTIAEGSWKSWAIPSGRLELVPGLSHEEARKISEKVGNTCYCHQGKKIYREKKFRT